MCPWSSWSVVPSCDQMRIVLTNVSKIYHSSGRATHASLAQLAKSPLGSRQSPRTQSVCPFSTATCWPFLHNRIVLSAPPVTMSVSERARTAQTAPSCPLRTCLVSQFCQTRAVLYSISTAHDQLKLWQPTHPRIPRQWSLQTCRDCKCCVGDPREGNRHRRLRGSGPEHQ